MKNMILTLILSVVFCLVVYAAALIFQYKITFVASLFSLGGLAYLCSCEVLNK